MSVTGFIPGIYNYCDQWCERCRFQSVCMNFVLGEKIKERLREEGDDEFPEDDELGIVLNDDTFDYTIDLLEELAEERGIEVEDIYLTERMNRTYWGDDYEDANLEEGEIGDILNLNDLMRSYMIYEWMTDQLQVEIYQAIERLEEDQEEINRIRKIDNALIEIGWYLDLLYGKLRRTLAGNYLMGRKLIEGETDDVNGSAKLCMVALEISRKQWDYLSEEFPDYTKEFQQIGVVSGQMLRDLELQFPMARAFRRPGFD